MNDNKKWSKRAGVLFWWTIASFPIIWLIGVMVGNIVSSNQTGNFPYIISDLNFLEFTTLFGRLVPNDLLVAISRLLSLIGCNNVVDGLDISPLTYILSWFIMIWLLHIVVDFILMLPKIAQKLIDKVCD